jgi:glycosyltransferase involved in cell wall biosynthesis
MTSDVARTSGSARREEAPPRVLFVQTQVENAGAQEISRLIGTGFSARGWDVRHLFFYARTPGAIDLAGAEVCVEARPRTPIALLATFAEVRRRIARIRPDVVFTFQHWGNAVGAPLARLATGVPVVANQVSAPELIGPVARALDRWWGRLGVYRLITTNSDETERFYDRHPAAYRRRLVPVPYGCERKIARLDRAAARARFGLPAAAPVVGCAARLNPTKRIDAAIRMLALLPGVHLALAGQGDVAADLAALATSLGIADRVHFLGELQPAEIGDFLAALDLFVFPSALESFGLAALEAAIAGVPVVASDLPVLREVLAIDGREAAVFVDVADPATFAGAVADLLADPARRGELSALGSSLARRHSLTAMIDAYVGLAERVCGRAA